MSDPIGWARIRLADHSVVADGLGPDAVVDDGDALWPIFAQSPTWDPATQDLGPVGLTVDVGGEQVISAPTVIDLDEAAVANRAAYAAASAFYRDRPASLAAGAAMAARAKVAEGNRLIAQDRAAEGLTLILKAQGVIR